MRNTHLSNGNSVRQGSQTDDMWAARGPVAGVHNRRAPSCPGYFILYGDA